MASVDVVLVEAGFSAGAVVAVCLVEITFFGADPEGCGFVVGEAEGRDGDFAGFVVASVDKLERFLCSEMNGVKR